MKIEKNRKMKGSVLLTVVSVMALLIIFLAGTLVLATATNRRAHRSYSTSQAEITARATIDSFMKAMNDNDDLAAAVQNFTGTIHPDVVINDKDLGHVGYYDASGTFHEDAITLEFIPNSGSYNFGKFNQSVGHENEEIWQQGDLVKISVTARVGKEEKTVAAYMTKSMVSKEDQGKDIGLYMAGNGNFSTTQAHITGDMAMGLTGDGSNIFNISNQTVFDGDLLFINGNTFMDGQVTLNFNDKSVGVVINGGLRVKNDNFAHILYTMANNFTQKDVPYLYVDRSLTTESQFKFDNPSSQPFNVFVGTWNTDGNMLDLGAVDLYLMDENDGSTLYDPYHYDYGGGSILTLTSDVSIAKGVNILGGTVDAKLYKWTNAISQSGGTQFDSVGGNIYCKGDLILKQVTVGGDVRVAGDLYLNGNNNINGNVYVGGNIYVTNNGGNIVGNIYGGEIAYDMKPGVTAATIASRNITPADRAVNPNIPSWVDKGFFVPAGSPDAGKYISESWNLGETKNDLGYYDVPGVGVTNDPALYGENPHFSTITVNGKTSLPLSSMPAAVKGYEADGVTVKTSNYDIYPSSMTREAVYGTVGPTGSLIPAPDATRITKNLTELRKDVKVDNAGNFDSTLYPLVCPAGDDTTLPKYTDASVRNAAGEIVASCYIDSTVPDGLTINPSGDVWIYIKDNTQLYDKKIYVKQAADGATGKCRFFVEKDLYLNHGYVIATTMNNGMNVKFDDKLNIYWYSANGAAIHGTNENSLTGFAKAPKMDIDFAKSEGQVSINYTDKFGATKNGFLPCWIGNVLVNNITNGTNNFSYAYITENGLSGGSGVTTAVGYFEVDYYAIS